MRPNAMVVLKSVVRWWCNYKEKPHPRYLECGFSDSDRISSLRFDILYALASYPKICIMWVQDPHDICFKGA